MVEALSTSRWKWTWWFGLLCCASGLVLFLSALLSSLFDLASGGPFYYTAVLGFAGLAVGVIGAVVSFVTTMLRRQSQPTKPVA